MTGSRPGLADRFDGSSGGGDGPSFNQIIAQAMKSAQPHHEIRSLTRLTTDSVLTRIKAHIFVFKLQSEGSSEWRTSKVEDIKTLLRETYAPHQGYFQTAFKAFLDNRLPDNLDYLKENNMEGVLRSIGVDACDALPDPDIMERFDGWANQLTLVENIEPFPGPKAGTHLA